MEVQLPRPVAQLVFRCSEETQTALLPILPIHEGLVLSDDLMQRTRETAQAVNPRIAVLLTESLPPADDGSVRVIVWDPATPPERIRVDPSDQQTRWIEQTSPSLPAGSGVVKLAIVVGKDGSVRGRYCGTAIRLR